MPSGLKRVFLTPLDTNDASDKEDVGTIRFEGDKVYKYVKVLNITATVAGVAGDVAAYGLALLAANTVVLDVTDSQTRPIGAGILQAAVAGVPGTAEFVWVQVRGAFTANQTLSGTPADGDALSVGADKVLDLVTAADEPVCAYADDASAKLCIAAFAF